MIGLVVSMKRLIIWLRHGALVVEWLLGVIWYLMTFWIPRKKAHPVADVYNAIQHPGGIYLFGRVMALRTSGIRANMGEDQFGPMTSIIASLSRCLSVIKRL